MKSNRLAKTNNKKPNNSMGVGRTLVRVMWDECDQNASYTVYERLKEKNGLSFLLLIPPRAMLCYLKKP